MPKRVSNSSRRRRRVTSAFSQEVLRLRNTPPLLEVRVAPVHCTVDVIGRTKAAEAHKLSASGVRHTARRQTNESGPESFFFEQCRKWGRCSTQETKDSFGNVGYKRVWQTIGNILMGQWMSRNPTGLLETTHPRGQSGQPMRWQQHIGGRGVDQVPDQRGGGHDHKKRTSLCTPPANSFMAVRMPCTGECSARKLLNRTRH